MNSSALDSVMFLASMLGQIAYSPFFLSFREPEVSVNGAAHFFIYFRFPLGDEY